MRRLSRWLTACMVFAAVFPGCAAERETPDPQTKALEIVAESDRQWTGIAVSPEGRIFVNYPRWSDTVPFSVGEVMADGNVVPYPNIEINQWGSGLDPAVQFVAVQSVYMDSGGFLWVLDTGNPQFTGVVPGGPKLVKIDLATDAIERVYGIDSDSVLSGSYLNDVRIDTGSGFAYISDSDAGGIIVVNLDSGDSRRVLADHYSTRSEEAVLTVGGKKWLRPDGTAPSVHVDGIALSPDRQHIYYQALSGRTMYRIGTVYLQDWSMDDTALAAKVEKVTQNGGAADGIMFGPDGNLYLTALEQDAVNILTPAGTIETLVSDPRLLWPDSFSITPEGMLYVTTAQIHLGAARTEPYRIFKIDIR